MPKPFRTRRSSKQNTLNFSTLETRSLLAALIDFDPTTNVVSIEGTDARDEVLVNYVDGYNNIRVTVSDATSQNTDLFASWLVSEIRFNGNGGDDLFRNNSHRASVVTGGSGNDELVGGWGSDTISGDAGNDRVVGRFSADILDGGTGSDFLYGDSGDDQIEGWSGNDTISAGAGNDTINAWYGNDIVFGGSGNDVINGSFGNDFLYASSGNDIVDGGEGNDLLRGGYGSDQLEGGSGKDRLRGDQNDDEINGSDGVDILFGGSGDDELSGGNDGDFLFGGTGEDFLVGNDGNDTLYGESGYDIIKGGDGNDGLFGGIGEADRLEGGKGADRLLSMVDSDNKLEELIFGWSSEDAVVRFEDLPNYTIDIVGAGPVSFTSQAWTDAEIKTVDKALEVLHRKVNNTSLLKTHQGVSLRFLRAGNIIGQNFIVGGWNTSGSIGLTNSAFSSNLRAIAVTYHEVGHNWDQITENSLMPKFEAISQWRNSAASGWTLSTGGGNWHFRDSASGFARDYGMWHPYEDYATTWETYFTSKYHGSNGWRGTDNIVAAKFASLDSLFAQLV